ncbi:MAG TPA: hypothetical protein VFQ38_17550 [Longimicrobiales bacterium]|nr:hypothetical protein [Longimicrobiales bacterium]
MPRAFLALIAILALARPVSAQSARIGAPAEAPGRARAGQGGAAVLARPGADTLGWIEPFGPVEVVGTEGGWTRVRVDGWVWTGSLATGADSAGVLAGLSAAALLANPDAYQGRVVAWSLQLIALRTAEKIRTDFTEGEPFLLTRGPGSEPGFVYVAVPPKLLEAARRLQPLQRVQVLARVRNGRSPLMGAPVLDLLELK